jgi:hypothetical protein
MENIQHLGTELALPLKYELGVYAIEVARYLTIKGKYLCKT